MQPKWYCDIEVRAEPLPRPMAASAIARVLHGAFRNSPKHYALAMPRHKGLAHSVLRVFASSREDLDALIENVRDAKSIINQAAIHYPRAVPENFSGG